MLSSSLDISEYIKKIFISLFVFLLDECQGDVNSQKAVALLDKIIQAHGGVSNSKIYSFLGELFSPQYEVAQNANDLKAFINMVMNKGWDQGCAYTILNKFIEIAQGSWNKDKFPFKFFTSLAKEVLQQDICIEVFAKKDSKNIYVASSIFHSVGNEILSSNAPSITPPIIPSPTEDYSDHGEDKFNPWSGRASTESLDVAHEENVIFAGDHNTIEGEVSSEGLEHDVGKEGAAVVLHMFSQGVTVSPVLLTPLAKVLLDQVGSNNMDELLRVCSDPNKPKF